MPDAFLTPHTAQTCNVRDAATTDLRATTFCLEQSAQPAAVLAAVPALISYVIGPGMNMENNVLRHHIPATAIPATATNATATTQIITVTNRGLTARDPEAAPATALTLRAIVPNTQLMKREPILTKKA